MDPQYHQPEIQDLSTRSQSQATSTAPPHNWIPLQDVLLSSQTVPNRAYVSYDSATSNQHQEQLSPAVGTAVVRENLNMHIKKRTSSPTSPNSYARASGMVSKKGHSTKKMRRSDSDNELREDKSERSHDKNHKVDILTTIVNQKKASLMRDPEVLAFFRKFVRNQA